MFVDIRKLTRQQVKEVLEAAGWAWDDAKSIDGEQNRRDCEALVNEAYRRGFKAGISAKTQLAAVVAAWDAAPNKKIKNPNYREPNTEIFFDELNDRRETMHILYVADNRNRHVATIKGSDPEKIDAEFKKRFGSENFERAWHPRTYGLDGDFLMGVDVQVIEAE